jgi:deoxyribonuclease V
MLICLDVDYQATGVTVACVGFEAWTDAAPALELVDRSSDAPAAYQPGTFADRELPYLLAILARVTAPIDAVIVDGYVWLGPTRPGLGAHLHAARGEPVIGVAKTSFHGAVPILVTRGASTSPLFVTAIGIDAQVAADHVRAMHGPFRIPTLLKRADTLARGSPGGSARPSEPAR